MKKVRQETKRKEPNLQNTDFKTVTTVTPCDDRNASPTRKNARHTSLTSVTRYLSALRSSPPCDDRHTRKGQRCELVETWAT